MNWLALNQITPANTIPYDNGLEFPAGVISCWTCLALAFLQGMPSRTEAAGRSLRSRCGGH